MSIPKYDELYGAVLDLLSDGKEHGSREMAGPIADAFSLTEEERAEQLPSQRQVAIVNRIGWARTYLKNAGLISSPKRAVFVITDRGRKALASNETIDNHYLAQFESFRAFKDRSTECDDSNNSGMQPKELASRVDESTPNEALAEALAHIYKQLSDDLLDEAMKISDQAFEQFVPDLMTSMGYGSVDNASQTTPFAGDEGIDGIIMEDKLGFDLIYVQAKHYAPDHAVGRPEIQAFVGAIAGRDGKGLFVTTSKFSKQAREYADHQHVVLVDGARLIELMIEHDFGVSTRKVYKLKTVDTDLFDGYLSN